MKFLSTFAARPGCLPEVMRRFLAGQAQPLPGVTLLGRWHKTDMSGRFSLSEADDPAKLYRSYSRRLVPSQTWRHRPDLATHLPQTYRRIQGQRANLSSESISASCNRNPVNYFSCQ